MVAWEGAPVGMEATKGEMMAEVGKLASCAGVHLAVAKEVAILGVIGIRRSAT